MKVPPPSVHRGYPSEPPDSLAICNRILDLYTQGLIGQAARLADRGAHKLAAATRATAGYGGYDD